MASRVQAERSFLEQWTAGLQLSEHGERVDDADIVSDNAGYAHVTWASAPAGESDASTIDPTLYSIFYSRWDGSRWSRPVDIAASSYGTLHPKLLIDSKWVLHLFYSENCLMHKSAYHSEAMIASSWSKPQCVMNKPVHRFGVAIDSNDFMYVVDPTGADVLFSKSTDRGNAWSSPVRIATSDRIGNTSTGALLHPYIAVDGLRRLHVVWTENPKPNYYPPSRVLYARSLDSGASWTSPLTLGGQDFGEPSITASGDNEIYVAWNGDAKIGGRYLIESRDGGKTWGKAQIAVKSTDLWGGLCEAPALVKDSAGVLHMLVSSDVGFGHVARKEGSWSSVEKLDSTYNYSPGAALVSGHMLAAVWVGLPSKNEANHVYVAFRELGLPATARETIPDKRPPTPFPSVAPTAVRVRTRPSTVIPSGETGLAQSEYASPPIWNFMLPLFPVPAIIGFVLLVRLRRMAR